MSRRRKWDDLADEDPAAGLLNLFDVWIAFAAALLLSMVGYLGMPELMSTKTSMTLIKNPGQADMELIQKQGVKIERYRATTEQMTGQGLKLGTAYRLNSGEVVYVPDGGAPAAAPPAR